MSSSWEEDGAKSLESNYTEDLDLRPRMLNLMNEFADAEMFLVDGDSLLMELALDEHLDWSYSGQLLHLVYLFERYLHLFVRKDGVFQIVFFKDFDDVWKSQPNIYLARKVIMQHVLANVSYKVLYEFKSPWDPKFVEYIKIFAPSFMLLSDGEILDECEDQQLIPGKASGIFTLHFLKILSLEMNCAFSYGIEFGASSLNGFHVMSSPRFRKLGSMLSKDELDRNLKEFCSSFNIANLTEVINSVLIKLNNSSYMFDTKCQDKDGVIDCRLNLHVVTVSVYLKVFPSAHKQGFQRDLVRILLLHGVLLTQLPLKFRAFSPDDCNNLLHNLNIHRELQENLAKLQFIMAEVLNVIQALKDDASSWSMSGICDAWDGRLLYQILFLVFENKRGSSEPPLSDSSQKRFETLVHVVSSMLDGEVNLEAFPIFEFFGSSECHLRSSFQEMKGMLTTTPAAEHETEGLIQMECSLLNEYAGKILTNSSVRKLDINDPGVAALVVSGNDFDERYHWHSGKPLSDEYDRTKENDYGNQDKRTSMRNRDKYARYMQRYGASLQGEVTYKPIIVEKKNKKKKNDNKISKRALAIQEENSQKMEKEKVKKEVESWENEMKRVQLLEEEGKYDVALGNLTRFLEGKTDGKTRMDVLLTKARIYWKKWGEYRNTTKDNQDESDAEMLFLTIQELLENYIKNLKDKDRDTLGKFLDALGFKDVISKTNLTTKSFESDEKYNLKISSSRFQLHNLGDKLKRETRTDRDSRVDHFIPEAWQRELLDAVDNKQSALIVAPTSSGKTFASYYCMEQVLKEDNDGIVVYVSPTKALVNQVAATCCARYKKEMPEGKSVYGVFTRDYRHNAMRCQILITVPECLEILLLSPARQDWVAKIKYVVFDEIHCIGSEIGAEVWEHLLLLIRCPFLALSATIRNPNDLYEWLQSAESNKLDRDKSNETLRPNSPKSYEVALIRYNERYNDLEKFNYIPARDEESKPTITHIHPCSTLTARQLEQSGIFPEHVILSPRETLAFYDALLNVFPEKDTLRRLSPESHFKDETFITKQSVRSYERALKEEFMTYVKNNDERVDTLLNSLRSSRIMNWSSYKLKDDFLISEIFPLLEKLMENDQLPVIFFSFDRALCEDLAEKVLDCLEQKEEQLVADKAKFEEKLERRIAKERKRQRDTEEVDEVRKRGPARYNEVRLKKKITTEGTCFLVDDPPAKGCSFAGKGVLDAEDACLIMGKLQRKGMKSNAVDEVFKEGLRRGISYHHAGMSNKQRSVVEMLFRKKFVRVVFATGTLALGIHMPCKTVVFAKDSVFLNTLQYHQISGRAGRRGYDLIGHVIFFGIPQAKIRRLMTVSLPRIIGNFPLNITLVLRLLLLVNKVKNREVAINQALTLLGNPLICKNQPELDLQLKHHFLFSVELLVRQGLVDQKGCPQGLAGLATHLHYHEPSNFVFVAFLHDGLLHEFCNTSDRYHDGQFSKDFLKSLVVMLNHLFARRKLHRMLKRRPRSTSKVVLEDLPDTFKAGLLKYNKKVSDVFDLYLRTVAGHVYDTLGEDVTLPLSSTKLISSENYRVNSPTVTLEDKLQAAAVPYKVCSAFAALSGNTDNRLYSSKKLISNIRYQVYTDVKVVPTLDVDGDFNAYAYDFYNHGNHKALIQENGLLSGETFQLLKDFMLVLKSISVSLTELAPEDGDDVIKAFTQLAEEFESKFYGAFY